MTFDSLPRNYAKISLTNKYDWPIRERIDAIEEKLQEADNNPVASAEESAALLAEFPDSPRLTLTRGLAIEATAYKKDLQEPTFAAEKARRQGLVKQVVAAAMHVVDLFEDLPLDYVEEHQDEEFFTMVKGMRCSLQNEKHNLVEILIF